MNATKGSGMMTDRLGAVILGAGLSQRMGQPKLLLPWGTELIITRIIHVLASAGLNDIVVVSGGSHDLLSQALKEEKTRIAFNPDFADGNMVHSIQVGLKALQQMGMDSALFALGDQPQIEKEVVDKVVAAWKEHPDGIILPSYRMRRGHPWVIPSALWQEVFDLQEGQTMRDFLRSQETCIRYVVVDNPTILADLDTPADYERERPR
jgi:molybdenum cofactor cytidylyltransferase